MKPTINNSGLALNQILATVALITIGTVLATKAFSTLFRTSNKINVKQANSLVTTQIGLHLMKIIGGTRSVQNIPLHLPGSGMPGLQSMGAGIIVEANKSISGANASGIDRIYIVQKSPTTERITLNIPTGTPLPSGSPLPVRVPNPSNLGPNYFEAGTYFIVTSGRLSDIFRLGTTVTYSPTVVTPTIFNLTRDLSSTASPTFVNPETFVAEDPLVKYRAGDTLVKAEFLLIGLDPVTNVLSYTNTRTGASHHIANGIQSFAVEYSIKTCSYMSGGYPLSLSTEPNDYSRADWATLNANPACYLKLRAIRINITDGSSAPESMVFPMN